MLGKLFKYEWKGFRTPLLIMLMILIGTTAIVCSIMLAIKEPTDNGLSDAFAALSIGISLLLYYFGIIGCSLGTVLTIVIRFYRTCYTDQGYLTHTLPVSTQKLLNVKIIASVIAHLSMFLAMAVSLFIVIGLGISHFYAIYDGTMLFSMFISSVFSELADVMGISVGGFIAYMVVYFIIAFITNIIIILGCVSLGQLYAKHRVLGAIIAYFVVQFALSMLLRVVMMLSWFGVDISGGETIFEVMSPRMNITLLCQVIFAVALYFANLHIMTKKLNLE